MTGVKALEIYLSIINLLGATGTPYFGVPVAILRNFRFFTRNFGGYGCIQAVFRMRNFVEPLRTRSGY